MSLPLFLIPAVRSTKRTSNRGVLAISGVTKLSGVPAPCRVHLHDATDGLVVGFRRTGGSGEYSFPDLAAGAYYLVVLDDRADSKRAKVEHVVL